MTFSLQSRIEGLMRRIVCGCVTLLAFCVATARAQRPSFEVVSLKLGDPNERRKGIGVRGNQLEVVNFPLKDMIGFAYDVETNQIFGGPKWIESDLFTITARPNVATPLRAPDDSANVLKLMLQSLLEERFTLAVHRETRVESIYELVVAKAGSRLKDSAGPDANGRQGFFGPPGYWVATNQPAASLVGPLSRQLGRAVRDKTGLTGRYDFTLRYVPELTQAAGDPNAPSVFTALEEQLGLKLESARGPVEVLVIDNAEKAQPD
jgi:uncharacterized protein (TIGR03435 family)